MKKPVVEARVLRRSLLFFCLVLAPLHGRDVRNGHDIRNGVYVSGTVGAQSMGTSTGSSSTLATSIPLNSTDLQDGLNGNLQNLVNDIKSLNASAAQVGTTFNVTQINPIEIQALQAQIQDLESQISVQIAHLIALMDSNPQTLNNANDQAIIQNYQNIFNTLKSIDGNLQQQIDQYNNKLTTDKDAYESQVNSVIKNNQQAQITYAQNQGTYTDQVTAYDRTTQELSHNLSTCIDSPDCLALPSTYSPTQVQQALNQMMQNTDSIVNSNMPWFFDGPYKNDTSKVITQSQWSQAVQEGNVRASHCQSVSCMHNFDVKFQEVLGPIGYSGISASQVTRVSAWFHPNRGGTCRFWLAYTGDSCDHQGL
ncbi:hypothetical protein HAL013_02760 [Helicobacter ailurogastricus]|uniref:Uncharacterized protein n=1 Tax=Helicobacter ailurogastricus TaxID=1578720 RepID=A0A0K2XBN3_9HELI|nr:hypothetical protein HAL011_06630 [Helicobacter ailurogastricus]CRF42119.1 hypothetical protein HAL013_02760 [Helicobacter ailurogastricus]CRF44033.1 hypothetical protein HAL09_06010 [Helicobacter ailurogastricus]